MDLRTGIIKPEPPYSFKQCLTYIKSFPASQNDHKIEANQLIKAFRLGNKTYAMQVINKGNVEKPHLKLTVMSTDKMNDEELENAIQQIRFYLGVDDDIMTFYETGEKDQMFKPIINQLYGHHLIKFPSLFEAAVWSLLRSSLTLQEAITHKKALQRRLGRMININGINYRAFPQPHDVMETPVDELELALPQERIRERIYNIATFFNSAAISKFNDNKTNDEIKDELLQFEGIDQGNTLFILNYGLGRFEEIHYGNPQLVNAVEKTYGTHYDINKEKIKEISSRYGRWKAYWAHYLILNHTK